MNFSKNPANDPVKTSWDFKEKWQTILTEIGGKWYMEKLNTNF